MTRWHNGYVTTFKYVFFSLLGAGAVAIAASWGARASLVYLSFVGLTAITSYGAAVASELLRRVSARRFAPPHAR
jgi:hypothetical protein